MGFAVASQPLRFCEEALLCRLLARIAGPAGWGACWLDRDPLAMQEQLERARRQDDLCCRSQRWLTDAREQCGCAASVVGWPELPLPAHRLWGHVPEPMPDPAFRYEPTERFGESLTTRRPWNVSALAAVEQLNGRVAMLGFAAALLGEWLTGLGPAGQLLALLRWYLGQG